MPRSPRAMGARGKVAAPAIAEAAIKAAPPATTGKLTENKDWNTVEF